MGRTKRRDKYELTTKDVMVEVAINLLLTIIFVAPIMIVVVKDLITLITNYF